MITVKNLLGLLLLVIAGSMPCFGQDTLIRTNGAIYVIHVIDMDNDSVSYRTFTQADGPLRKLSLSDVQQIKYRDGSIFPEIVEEVFMLPGYDELKPYLKDWDGNLQYYYRVGFHQKWFIAYPNPDDFTEIDHDEIESGCVSKKKEFYQFITRDMAYEPGGYILREGDDDQYFILVAEGDQMILCTDLMYVGKTKVYFAGTGVTHGYYFPGSPGLPLLGTAYGASSKAKFYYYDGVNITKMYFTLEDVAKWKAGFTKCPYMVEAINQFYATAADVSEDEMEVRIRALMEDLAFIF